jgi:hypothetical protein
MGNRAKRAALGRLLKEKGIPSRLYRGNKKVAWRRLFADNLDEMIYKLGFYEVGNIVNDCYGPNQKIAGWATRPEKENDPYFTVAPPSEYFQYEFQRWYGDGIRKSKNKSWKRRGFHKFAYFLSIPQFAYEDGIWSCGCDTSPEAAKTREEIEQSWIDISNEDLQAMDENSREFKIYCWLKAGGHIHDEDGIMLPEWRKSQT